jgi:hypothetical protein
MVKQLVISSYYVKRIPHHLSMNKGGCIVPPNKQILRDRVTSLASNYGATFGRRAWTQRRGQVHATT